MKKIKIDLIKVEEILTRDQLKYVVGGAGSFGQSCTNDPDCWEKTGGQAYCSGGKCIPYPGEGSSNTGCADRPIYQQCHGSTLGCCPSSLDTCQYTTGGYQCFGSTRI
ncbi:hypothetical protein SAMN04488511_107143 [Pedobacter suwonensis]|uniref:Uncharacterized protein n=1 Tax=Pedobacter suwonensis TaxID=332999 RepID=A0A1I0T9M3_9SPHI|nr:hypothetical protein SAMN04488511_107143 [Pedobacter suwonensis]